MYHPLEEHNLYIYHPNHVFTNVHIKNGQNIIYLDYRNISYPLCSERIFIQEISVI